jgi:hypothetical protein
MSDVIAMTSVSTEAVWERDPKSADMASVSASQFSTNKAMSRSMRFWRNAADGGPSAK